jgi:KipI family sensor histidine kinase inhibitor
MNATIEPLGDSALLIRLGEHIDAELNARAVALAAAVRASSLPGVLDVAPAYASVCVRYDPAAWSTIRLSAFDAIAARVGTFVDNAASTPIQAPSPVLEIPVCYGGEFGPDLGAVAQHAGLDKAAVIARHNAADYRVAMLGFAPGFPYLLGLDPALHTPRRASPRTRVPAGSVAIGGAQTGIYPRASPGGWQIIGRTPLRLFDPHRDPPAWLAAGARVRFRAIDAEQFVTATP